MIKNFYPNLIIVQRLQAGPLSAHIDTFVQLLFDEGYTGRYRPDNDLMAFLKGLK